jgi:hypothetical protein
VMNRVSNLKLQPRFMSLRRRAPFICNVMYVSTVSYPWFCLCMIVPISMVLSPLVWQSSFHQLAPPE